LATLNMTREIDTCTFCHASYI